MSEGLARLELGGEKATDEELVVILHAERPWASDSELAAVVGKAPEWAASALHEFEVRKRDLRGVRNYPVAWRMLRFGR